MTHDLRIKESPIQFSFMGNVKPTGDWKFWVQLGVILMAIGGGLNANSSMQKKVDALEKSNEQKTEIILRMEGKFDLLNWQIQQLKERLEAKKIVNSTAFDASQLSGNEITERK